MSDLASTGIKKRFSRKKTLEGEETDEFNIDKEEGSEYEYDLSNLASVTITSTAEMCGIVWGLSQRGYFLPENRTVFEGHLRLLVARERLEMLELERGSRLGGKNGVVNT